MAPAESSRVAGSPYPPIADYALLGDCHSVALVSRSGSIDWCCMPRLDSPSVFGRLLDWEQGGSFSVSLDHEEVETDRRYVDSTMVLETTMRSARGAIRIVDGLAMTEGGAEHPRRQLFRKVSCLEGSVRVEVEISPRFDYGSIRPWLRAHEDGHFSVLGGSEGLAVWSDLPLEIDDRAALTCAVELTAGEERWLTLVYVEPETLDESPPSGLSAALLADRLDETVEWWRQWAGDHDGPQDLRADVLRSALVLKSLVNASTGAIAAAPTTSLPEQIGGERNWDYRFSWIRDSWLTVRSLAEIGFHAEADGFRRFIERAAAGSVDELQLLYAVDGGHRVDEWTLDLAGYRGSTPVRVGNAAREQRQLDMYGYLVDLAWQWIRRGHSPDPDYWRFILQLVDRVCECWPEPDQGIWEMRSEPRHHVHSKVLCWTAVDRGLRLAEELGRTDDIDLDRWESTRDEIRALVEDRGVSAGRGCFTQVLGGEDVDAALLLLPAAGFVEYDDPRMVATVDAVLSDLTERGLVSRYRTEDGLTGHEGCFVACTFWLVECLAGAGRDEEAEQHYEAALRAANDLGLYAEEMDPATGELLGNFPQALSHLAQISAAIALHRGP